MGYTTDFEGAFQISPPMEEHHRAYLLQLAMTRRMARDSRLTVDRPDPLRHAVGLGVGEQGEFFVGAEGFAGQESTPDILDYNRPPRTQPGLWLQWVPSTDGTQLVWDGGEKFYSYVEWLRYLQKLVKQWGYTITGRVRYRGEDFSDTGTIVTDGVTVWVE